MAPLYSVRPAPNGWLVYDVCTGRALVLEGREQTGLSLDQAERLADRLNARAIAQLVSFAANDR